MKLPQVLLGTILLGLTAQTTSCIKKDDPSPKQEQGKNGKKGPKVPDGCPGCGLG